MNKEVDELLVVSVLEKPSRTIIPFVPDIFSRFDDYEALMKKDVKALLEECAKELDKLGVKYSLHMGISGHVGEMIILLQQKYEADFIIMGRRGLGVVKRLLMGSTSKYVMEHAACNVLIVKQDLPPDEIHDSKEKVLKAEEKERERRIKEEENFQKNEKWKSELDLNIVKLAEEEERIRRVNSEKKLLKKEEDERNATLGQVIAEEEKERDRRIKEDNSMEERQFKVTVYHYDELAH